MGRLLAKDGVEFGAQAGWAGARILEVTKFVIIRYEFDITITSARDGQHAPNSPHYEGNAFDFRTHGLPEGAAMRFLRDLSLALGPRFYAFLEAPGTPNEHIHCQQAKGTTYSALQYLQNA